MNREEIWLKKYNAAKKYKKEFGDLKVPRGYITSDGIKLGEWIATQKCAKRGTGRWKINQKQIRLLDALGIDWGVDKKETQKTTISQKAKNKLFMESAHNHYEQYGNLDFPKDSPESKWLQGLRWSAAARKDKTQPPKDSSDTFGRLSKKNIEELNSMGMNWDVDLIVTKQLKMERLRVYYNKYGNVDVPVNYIDEEGYHLGSWISYQRYKNRPYTNGEIDDDIKTLLNELGITWNLRLDQRLDKVLSYKKDFGDIDIPYGREDKLREWLDYEHSLKGTNKENTLITMFFKKHKIKW